MRFTVATYNIHKGFSHLNRRMVIHELRERLHGLSARHPVPAGSAGRPRPPRGALSRLAGASRSTSSSPTRSGTRSPTARTPSTATAITATRCCRAFRSSRRRTRTSPRTRSRAAACCIARSSSGRGAPALHCINVHLGLFERGRQWQIRALCERIRATVPEDAPLIIAGDFNDWRQQGRPHARRRARRARGVRGRCAAGRRARFRRCCRCSASTASTRAASTIVDARVHYAFPRRPACPTTRRSRRRSKSPRGASRRRR